MRFLLEQPLPIFLTGMLATIILAVAWARSGSKKLIFAIGGVIGLTVLLLIVEKAVVTDSEAVEKTIRRIAAAVERGDWESAFEYIHSGSPEIRTRAESELPSYQIRDVNIKRNLTIEIFSDEDPPRAVAEFNVTVVLGSDDDNIQEIFENRRIPRFVRITFLKESDKWRLSDYDHFQPQRGMQRKK